MRRTHFASGLVLWSVLLVVVTPWCGGVRAEPAFQLGWPQVPDAPIVSSPVLADFDPSVPGLEVICMISLCTPYADTTGVMIWHQDGSPLPGWSPRKFPGEAPNAGVDPSLADLDGDGALDLVLSTSNRLHALVWRGAEVAGWPVTLGAFSTGSPVVADLDRDGLLEVLLTDTDRFLRIWRSSGATFRPEVWPRRLASPVLVVPPPAVGNLDADPELEIVVGGSSLHALNPDGSYVSGSWPIAFTGMSQATSPPVIGDLDGDGSAEVVIGSGFGVAYPSWVHVFHADGTTLPGWPFRVQAYPTLFALADLDPGFPGLEILVAPQYGHRTWALHLDTSTVPGWPFEADPEEQMGDAVLVGDFNPAPGLEVCTSGYAGLYVMGQDGTPWPDLPYTDEWVCQYSPAMADLDGDGSIEVALCSLRRLAIWEVGQGSSRDGADLPWPMSQHDLQHTGCIQSGDVSGLTAEYSSVLPGLVARCVPNPAVGAVGINLTLSVPSEVRLRIVSPAGASVRSLSWDRLPAGSSRIEWDGRDQSGNRAPGGQYFYQMGSGDGFTSGRLIFIR